MSNPVFDFWNFVLGNTEDHNALGSSKYLLVALFLALIGASVVIAVRNWREDPSQRTGRHLATWFVRVLVGDRVIVELAARDLGRGRIVRKA